ncbi:MAG TPA: hypothetical protein VG432_07890 [Gemmatimonadaceae bacterium]|nr:hypothetical protein [Gemmatimonadaceae bacterium]
MPTKIRSLSALLVAAGAFAGCASFSSVFPSHEDVFTPIAPNVGVTRVQGRDTTWVLTGTGYELTAGNRNLLPPVQAALDGAAADFRAYMGGDPPTVSIVAIQLKRGQRPDTARLAQIRAGGAVPVYVRLAEQGRGMAVGTMMSDDMVSLSPVVRKWMSTLASAPASPAGASSSAGVPKWLEVAVPRLVDGWSDADLVAAQVGLHPDRIIGLRSIFSGLRPADDGNARRGRGGADSLNAEFDRRGRGGARARYQQARRNPKDLPALSGAALWDAEAVSVTNYLASREGRPFIGSAARALMAGATMDAVLAGAQMVPRDVDTLDRAWRDWLATQAEAVRNPR